MTFRKTLCILLTLLLCAVCFGCANETGDTVPVQIEYDTATVSYLGPEGTYTQEACGQFFEKKGTYIPYETVNDAVEAMVKGESAYAVIPQENTIGGAVIDYVDTLLDQTAVSVVGEVELPINQNLLVYPGAALKNIKTVYSHKQGIAQGRDWLKENLPDAEIVEVSSTAEGAKTVSEGKDPSRAAIASAACAEVYGLDILAAGIQNNESNKTRFYVLCADPPATAAADRLAFIARGDAEDLPALLGEMEKQNVTLVTLHDRPLKTELGEYCYLIECENCDYAGYLKLTRNSDFEFQFLGCFDVR